MVDAGTLVPILTGINGASGPTIPGPDCASSWPGRSGLFREFLDYPVWVRGARKDRIMNTDDSSLADNHGEALDEHFAFNLEGG